MVRMSVSFPLGHHEIRGVGLGADKSGRAKCAESLAAGEVIPAPVAGHVTLELILARLAVAEHGHWPQGDDHVFLGLPERLIRVQERATGLQICGEDAPGRYFSHLGSLPGVSLAVYTVRNPGPCVQGYRGSVIISLSSW